MARIDLINVKPEQDPIKSWDMKFGISEKLPDIRKEIATVYAMFDKYLTSICPDSSEGLKLTDNLPDAFVQAWLERQVELAQKVYKASGYYESLGFFSQEGKK